MSVTQPIQMLHDYSEVRDWTGHGALHCMWGCVVLRNDHVTGRNVWVIAHQSTDRAVSYEFCQAMASIWGNDRVAMVAPDSAFKRRDFGKYQHKTKG